MVMTPADGAPLQTPADVIDVMAGRCENANRHPLQLKIDQTLVIGYVRGYAESVAAACDSGLKSAACTRIHDRTISYDVVVDAPRRTEQLCRRHPDWTLRQVGLGIIAEARMDYGMKARDMKKMDKR